MAIYHLSIKPISRAKGYSAVSKAAYRSAEKIYDQRLNQSFDYTKKNDLFFKEVFAPKDAPEWMRDRTKLWNHVEQIEKRKDARPAMEIEVSLPKELTPEQNIKLIKEFAKTELVSKGLVVDVCLHKGHNKEQPHAHIMYTTREIVEDDFGKKIAELYQRSFVYKCREAWANIANRHLAQNGHEVKIDHRSYRNQGIDLEPQNKIGSPSARKIYHENVEYHEKIAHENGEKIYEDPRIALDALTKIQSTFTLEDLAKFINRHTDNAEQFTKVFEKIKADKNLINLGKDAMNKERYTSQEMLDIEYHMAKHAIEKSKQSSHEINFSLRSELSKKAGLSPEQELAVNHITGDRDLACIVGFAGTGKSYLLGVARELWEEKGYTVTGITLSGIAAEQLESGSGIRSYTLASRKWNWENDKQKLKQNDVVVVDEAGMLSSRDLGLLLNEANKSGAKVILVGDPEQLKAILSGAGFRAILERVGYVELNDIRRQKEKWQKQATVYLATGNSKLALNAYAKKGCVHAYNAQSEAMNRMVEAWNENRRVEPDKTRIMLAYRRNEVAELNKLARQWRKEYGELGEGRIFQTENGKREFAVNDIVYFLKNDQYFGVKNGTLGVVKEVGDKSLVIDVKGNLKRINIKKYNSIDHGYAATIHRVQGITVDRSYVLVSRLFNRHLAYVGLTRHRESTEVYWAQDQIKSFSHLSYLFNREQFKDVSLDYLHNATSARDIKINGTTLEQMRKKTDRLFDYAKFSRELAKEFADIEKEMACKVNTKPKYGESGKYVGEIELCGRNFEVVERNGLKKTLYFVANGKVAKDVTSDADVRIVKHIDNEGKSNYEVVTEKSWMPKSIRETRETNELNKASHFIHKAARKLASGETVKLSNRITTNQLYAALYDKIPNLLPEFAFVKKGSYYISMSGNKIDGSVGSEKKVYIYENNPGILIDYTQGKVSIWEYVRIHHMPAASNHEIFRYLASQAGLGGVFEKKYNLWQSLAKPSAQIAVDAEKAKPTVESEVWEKVYAFALDRIRVTNNQVSKYLENERGYTRDMIKGMGIGYIPSKKHLGEYLRTLGVEETKVIEVIKSLGYIGGDHKMVIPYYDQHGKIIGLSGRNIKHGPNSGTAKYMYTKGLVRNNTLLNIHDIDKNRELIVVEGVLDYLHAKALGINNVVALGGTGFSHRQADMLKNMGINKITLCLDSDKAGQDAANRIGGLIFDKHPDAQVKLAKMPQGIKDFDELITVKGVVKAMETIAKAEVKTKDDFEAARSNTLGADLNQTQRLTL